jgi:hypothetical protein
MLSEDKVRAVLFKLNMLGFEEEYDADKEIRIAYVRTLKLMKSILIYKIFKLHNTYTKL